MTLDNHILDELVVAARPLGAAGCPVELQGAGLPAPLHNFLNYLSLDALPLLAEALHQRVGFGYNEEGYTYLPAAEGRPATTVAIYDFTGHVQVTEAAFRRLLARFLGTLVQVASARPGAVQAEAWWAAFREQVASLEAELPAGQ